MRYIDAFNHFFPDALWHAPAEHRRQGHRQAHAGHPRHLRPGRAAALGGTLPRRQRLFPGDLARHAAAGSAGRAGADHRAREDRQRRPGRAVREAPDRVLRLARVPAHERAGRRARSRAGLRRRARAGCRSTPTSTARRWTRNGSSRCSRPRPRPDKRRVPPPVPHVRHAGLQDRSRSRMYEIWWTFGWPYETSTAMARLVFSGIMDKLAGAEGAGAPPGRHGALLRRPGWARAGISWASAPRTRTWAQVLTRLKRRPFDYFKDFYADTAVFGSKPATECGLDFFGADKVLFASDCPFDPERGPGYIRDTIAIVESLELSPGGPGEDLLPQRRKAVRDDAVSGRRRAQRTGGHGHAQGCWRRRRCFRWQGLQRRATRQRRTCRCGGTGSSSRKATPGSR